MKVIGILRRVRLRGRERVDWLFTFTAAAYDLRRLPRLQAQAVARTAVEKRPRKGPDRPPAAAPNPLGVTDLS